MTITVPKTYTPRAAANMLDRLANAAVDLMFAAVLAGHHAAACRFRNHAADLAGAALRADRMVS